MRVATIFIGLVSVAVIGMLLLALGRATLPVQRIVPPSVASEDASPTLQEPGPFADGRSDFSLSEEPLRSVLLVEDVSHLPVSDLTVWSVFRGSAAKLGTTDAGGKLLVPLLQDAPLVIRGVGGGYVLTPRYLKPPHPAKIVLMAVPEGRLSGYVVGPHESTVGEGVRILVFDESHPPPADSLPDPSRRTGLQSWAVTDSRGRFTVDGLDPARKYSLAAGGDGLASLRTLLGLRPGIDEVRVDVRSIYGVILELRQSESFPRCLDIGSMTSRSKMSGSHIGLSTGVGIRVAALLAGLDPSLLRGASHVRQLHLFTSEDRRSVAGPLIYEIDLPGYRAERLELDAWRLDRGPSFHVIELEPDGTGLGSLRLVLRSNSPPGGPGGVLGTSHVSLYGPNGLVAQYRIPNLSGTQEIGCIPVGTYTCRVSLHGGLITFPEEGELRTVKIVEGTTELVLDLPPAGNLLVRAIDEGGIEHDAAAAFTLAPMERVVALSNGGLEIHGALYQVFDTAPYRFDALPAGEYVLFASSSNPADGTRVIVEPGEETVVETRL